MKDPYVILGVAKSATLDEIKSAYKKLARKYHPDLNPGNKEAEAKFKDVNHAYDQIGTEDARAKFDRGETDEQKQHAYDEYMKGGQRRQGPFYHQTQSDYGRYSQNFGEGFDEDIFANIFGGRSRAGGFDLPGEDETYQMEVDFREAALGAEKIITLPSGKKLQVKIPAGIHEGQKLKFKGLGGPGIGKGRPGDAYVQLNIRPSSDFTREGKDIHSVLAVSLFEAINGAEVEVPTIDGAVKLTIPPGVSTGTKLRIKNKGAGFGDNRGGHIVELKVVLPKGPPEEFKTAIQNLGERFAYNPRGNA